MTLLILCYLVLAGFTASLFISKRRFDQQRDSIRYRIHVNGIRGKSTVTRYVAAILRQQGIKTYGKTTGTAARVILPDGQDAVIRRRGYPNVNEQLGIIRSFAARQAEAAVVECMAINPDYQDWLENHVMHSHIAIITNVRIDHQEEMGKELQDIARSLARSIPRKAILITAERRPDILAILNEVCKKRGTKLLQAPVWQVSQADLAGFGHVAHKENVAIGLAVAKLLGIDNRQALQAMAEAPADPGAFRIQSFEQAGKQVKWANLFAVNDKESFASLADDLANKYSDYFKVALLNNRHDRPSRVEMFSTLAQQNLKADAIVALGDYEERIKKSVNNNDITVALLGNTSKHASASGRDLLDKIIGLADKASHTKVLLVGTVNIHTRQSESILRHIAKLTSSNTVAPSALPQYIPTKKVRVGLNKIINKIDLTQPNQAELSAAKGAK